MSNDDKKSENKLISLVPVDELLHNLSFEEINEILKVADQAVQDTIEEAREEYKKCVLRNSHENLSKWVLSSQACSSFKIKANNKAICDWLNAKGENASSEYLNACTESCIKEGVEKFNNKDYKTGYSTQNLKFLEKESTAEDLRILSLRFGMMNFLSSLEAKELRLHCKALNIHRSGETSTLIRRIMDHLYYLPLREIKDTNRDNEHPDDKILDGIALVKREKGEPKTIEFLKPAWNLRRICINLCSYGEESSLKGENWDNVQKDEKEEDEGQNDSDDEEEDEDENSKNVILAPQFLFDDIVFGRWKLSIINSDSKLVKGESWVESIRKKQANKLKSDNNAEKTVFGLDTFCKWLDKIRPIDPAIKSISESDIVSFPQLVYTMYPDRIVIGYEPEFRSVSLGFLVLNSEFTSKMVKNEALGRKVRTWTFNYTVVSIHSTGSSFVYVKYSNDIPQFEGEVAKKLLPYRYADEESTEMLKLRGERYVKLSLGSQFKYHGEESFMQRREFHVKPGRMMIDIDAGRSRGHFSGYFSRHREKTVGDAAEARLKKWSNKKHNDKDSKSNKIPYEMETVPEKFLCICWAAIAAFSFEFKAWGFVFVNSIQDVRWNDRAFDQLVLDQGRKDLIHAIVKNTEKLSTDIIDGKGGGSIILLHGPPGTGKTLTAEAVAEMLHKPLYYVSVAELGITPSDLEKNLTNVLALSLIWKSVLLMDEADIFLEQRGLHEIERNAMVGVIIKKLEYYQGILFLTSNRVASFDLAFYSRITVAFHYNALDESSREAVWKMLFDASGINLDSKPFGKYVLNGRQIKNCITLAKGVALVSKREIKHEDIMKTITVNTDFMETVKQRRIA